MREGLRMVMTLLVTCVVAGLALAGVHGQTTPIIEKAEEQALLDGLARVVPDAARFEVVPNEDLGEHGEAVQAAWVALDASNQPVGYVVEAAPGGYGGPIRMLVGVTPEGAVGRVEILSAASETPGLGSKAAEPEHVEQYTGLEGPVGLVKGQAPTGNQVQAVTGATISSQAVLDGVNQALELATQLNERG